MTAGIFPEPGILTEIPPRSALEIHLGIPTKILLEICPWILQGIPLRILHKIPSKVPSGIPLGIPPVMVSA